MKKSLKKRIIGLLMTVVTTISMSAVAFAADYDTPVGPEVPEDPQIIGGLLTSCGGDMSGGYGELTCYLASGNSNADICAGVSASTNSGSVSCYVIFPSGASQYLGTISATGGNTGYYEFGYLSPGTYKFEFYSSTDATLYVYGRIYD